MRNTIGKNNNLSPYTFSLLTIITLFVAGEISSATPYFPPENIAISCGNFGYLSSQVDLRDWIGDVKSKFTPIDEQLLGQNHSSSSSITGKADKQATSKDQIPYLTARFSRSQFTYTFHLTAGPKFIRLHFYPASYGQNFHRPDAFFSVKANHYTLLRNFSASLTADFLGEQTVDREFCINVGGTQILNLTFTPSSNAYAFINGIEIVSMPDYLYYNRETDPGFKFIGPSNPLIVNNEFALETVYRLNVGGGSISPRKDTGMFRTWFGDDKYLSEQGSGVWPVNLTIQISYMKTEEYTAPEEVYITARTMGLNKTENYNYNLTWALPVDCGFIYLVRLHFCEFQFEIAKENDRQFHIYIANQTAEAYFDVIAWSGGNGHPVYTDYAVFIAGDNGNRENLTIALHPNPVSNTRYSDAILNGAEVFKLSNPDGNLAGANPNPPPMLPHIEPSPEHKKDGNKTYSYIAGGVLAGTAVAFFIGFLIFRRARRVRDSGTGSTDGASKWGQFSYTTVQLKSSKTSCSSLPSDLCHHFSLAEIKIATHNFNDTCIVGVGGFGNVYKGYINLNGAATPVAIKRLNPKSRQGAHEFKTEIEMLSRLRHMHLVSLIGYCNDDREMILVYDYMAHGTLRDHIYKTDNPPISWKKRLEICIGAARGLNYLHTGAKHMIIHRDVKTTNILLDENWVAKVSDFGLSKVGPTSMSKAHVSTMVKGSMGYLDPEYYLRQMLTEKSDVYSFGVVLFEVLSARQALDRNLPQEQVSLAVWAQKCYYNETLDQIIDANLNGQIAPECLKKFGEIAASCLLDEGIKRPSMSDVLWGLEFALQLQESAEERFDFVVSKGEMIECEEVALVASADDDKDDVSIDSSGFLGGTVSKPSTSEQSIATTDSNIMMTSGSMFSEIKKPQGR